MLKLRLLQGGRQDVDVIRPDLRNQFPARAEVCRRLILARQMAEFTTHKAARLVGVQRSWLLTLEAGLNEPSRVELASLAQIYGVSVDWLLGLVPELADAEELGPYASLMSEEIRFRMRVYLGASREAQAGA